MPYNPIVHLKNMKLIVKKTKSFYGNKNGLIKPLFEISDNGKLIPISQNDYPNNGNIFVFDYELLDSHIKTDIFIIDKCFFISDDANFADRASDINASLKRISYNAGISSFFSETCPNLYIPIYTNKFNLQNHKLINTENIINDIFFLKDSDNLVFGPFERDNLELKAVNFKNYDYDYDNNYRYFLDLFTDYDGSIIYKIEYNTIQKYSIKDSDGNEYIENFTNLIEDTIGEIIEFTPITILHNWIIEKLKHKPFKITSYLEDIKNIEALFNSSLDKLKWNKYLNHIIKSHEYSDYIDQLVTKLNEKGYVEDVASNGKIETINRELQDLKNSNQIKSDEIIRLKDKRDELENELKLLKEKGTEFVDLKKYPNLSALINDPIGLKEIDNIISTKSEYEVVSDDLKKLEGKREALEESIKRSEESQRKIEDSIRIIKSNFDKDVSEHTAKLADAKMYTDLLNGINVNLNKKQHERENIKKVDLIAIPSEITSAKLYVNEIQKRLKNLNRELSFNDVANLIITINHSFLTIIAGAPGVGKTSLVNKFSNALGLNEEFGYLEINCARGWTSSRDLLGFYNPLTEKYQSSKTNLKRALIQSSENLNSPYNILLDEANLSPLEHYWSDFIKLADDDYKRNVKISEKEEITFGEGFRFIATINHDHTTEGLSNRLIDRAAIIQLEKPLSINENIISEDKIANIFDFKEVKNLFHETAKWKSDEGLIINFLQHIKDKIESNNTGIIISPRKELAIRKYCRVGTGLMDGNTYTALDYAVSQHILPLINGRGDNFEEVLKSLKNDISDKGMLKSEKLLNKILERGKDLKHFKYVFY